MVARLATHRLFQMVLAVLVALLLPTAALVALAYGFIDIHGPAGSGAFGQAVTVLSNGNFVVSDPLYTAGAVSHVGAAYLYDGVTHQLISTLVGSTANDQVGVYVTALSNGNYVVRSPYWHKGAATNVGAVTWCSGTLGCAGAVTSSNSLVGSTAGDEVGSSGVITLSNGNYVVGSNYWNNGAVTSVGAVTWCSGTLGCTGPVTTTNSLLGSTVNDNVGGGVTALSNGNYVVFSPYWNSGATNSAGAVTWCSGTVGCTGVVVTTSNSLVGSTANDQVGIGGGYFTELSNGNYLVVSSHWSNGAAAGAGAVTWCSGTAACTGPVTTTNSLVGSTAGDGVGNAIGGVTALSNGNYVVDTYNWSNGAVTAVGAATWCSGTVGCIGAVTTTNSLVGSTAFDSVSAQGVTALSNGSYVVKSGSWHNGAAAGAGAVTWCSGTVGCTGVVVTTTNSLVGSTAFDNVGGFGITELSNGNYVVNSAFWNNGAAVQAGAVTWCSGTLACAGSVTTTNSLVGSTTDDRVGYDGVAALSNGNYTVASSRWNNGALTQAGAVTWCDGTLGCTGAVTTTNSLVGSLADDLVGSNQAVALSDGKYVVDSPYWNNGPIAHVGAVTWCSGTAGCTGGVVTTSNSLVGSTAGDQVGYYSVGALRNGNYVVSSANWHNGAIAQAGAVTWCSGTAGCTGVMVTTSNSLVGSTAGDQVGGYGITALSNGNFAVRSPHWHNGAATDAGAVTLGNGAAGVVGPITAENSVRGTAAAGGSLLVVAIDSVHNLLVVGRPADNIVSLFGLFKLSLPLVTRP